MMTYISSWYLVETMIFFLFRSKKSKKVITTNEGKLLLKGGEPLISIYLGYGENNRPLTPSIAEQLKLRFLYHLYPKKRVDRSSDDEVDFDFMY